MLNSGFEKVLLTDFLSKLKISCVLQLNLIADEFERFFSS